VHRNKSLRWNYGEDLNYRKLSFLERLNEKQIILMQQGVSDLNDPLNLVADEEKRSPLRMASRF
jgi:hypothetical protein